MRRGSVLAFCITFGGRRRGFFYGIRIGFGFLISLWLGSFGLVIDGYGNVFEFEYDGFFFGLCDGLDLHVSGFLFAGQAVGDFGSSFGQAIFGFG